MVGLASFYSVGCKFGRAEKENVKTAPLRHQFVTGHKHTNRPFHFLVHLHPPPHPLGLLGGEMTKEIS